jgi:phenylpropionate dioxygenase-like ring-hydroxylating dioxygenase large terminal subunit
MPRPPVKRYNCPKHGWYYGHVGVCTACVAVSVKPREASK